MVLVRIGKSTVSLGLGGSRGGGGMEWFEFGVVPGGSC